jgi:hypothetical protein
LRRDLVRRLPRLLEKALSTYTYFANTTPPEGAKDFTAFQASCRAALAHIHLLIKLAQWARSVSDDGCALYASDDEHIHKLIEEAETALSHVSSDDM